MKEFFREMFANTGLNEEQIDGFYADFVSVMIATILSGSNDILSDSDAEQVAQLLKDKKLDEVLNVVKSKYSDEEWVEFIKTNISPVCESYIKEVVLVKK